MWTEEQFKAWKGRPETEEFLAFLGDVRESLKNRWADGDTLNDADHAVAMVYGDIVNLNYDESVRPFYHEEEADDVQE